MQKTFENGRFRVSIGFNFGEHVGDSILGEIIAQDDVEAPTIRPVLESLAVLGVVTRSELHRDLTTLLAPSDSEEVLR